MPTHYADLVPSGAAREMVAAITQQSVVLRLANVTPVPTSETAVPIVSLEPVAKFISTGGRKPARWRKRERRDSNRRPPA